MSDPLLIVELAPLLLAGAAALTAAFVVWLRGPRTGLTNALTLLLVFLGHLALVGTLVALPNDPGFAPRLLPVFQLATVGATLAFLIFLFEPRLDARRADALLSSAIIATAAFIGLSLWRPDLYWGTTETVGPLFATTGIRTALFASVAWLLATHALTQRGAFPHLSRASAYLLSAGFALVAVHDATTAALRSAIEGALHPSAAYLGAPLLAGLFVHLGFLTRRGRDDATRRQAAQYLLVGLVPALISVLVIDLVVFRLAGGDRTALFLDLVLRHLWMTALPLSAIWALRVQTGLASPSPARVRPTGSAREGRAADPPAAMPLRDTLPRVRQT